MILGALDIEEGAAPAGGYAMKAVTFNSARLSCASLSCTDNGFLGFAGWFKAPWEMQSVGNVFTTDSAGNFNAHYMAGTIEYASGPDTTHSMGIDLFNEPPLAEDTWQHFIGALNTNMTAPKTRKLYLT